MFTLLIMSALCFVVSVTGNLHSGISGNCSIVASGVYTSQELLKITRCKFSCSEAFFHQASFCLIKFPRIIMQNDGSDKRLQAISVGISSTSCPI